MAGEDGANGDVAVPPDDPGAARRRGSSGCRRRSARRSSAPRSSARSSRSARCASSRRRTSARPRRPRARARPQGARPARARGRGRRRLPLPAPADPRRRLRGDAEGGAGRAARALRRPARGASGERGASSTRSSATTSSRRTGTAPSSGRSTRAGRRSGERAAERLAAGGQRALGRGDLHAAETLLERAIALLGPDDRRVADLVCDLSIVMRDQGRLDEAEAALTGVVERRRPTRPCGRAPSCSAPTCGALKGGSQATALETAERVIRLLEERGAERRAGRGVQPARHLPHVAGQHAGGTRGVRAGGRAREAHGHARVLAQNSWWRLANALWGPTTVEDALELCGGSGTRPRAPDECGGHEPEGAFLLMRERRRRRGPRAGGRGRRRLSRSSASASPASPAAWWSRSRTCSRAS